MTDREYMGRRLGRVALRLRWHGALAWAGRGFLAGSIAAVALVVASRFLPSIPAVECAAAVAATGVLGGLIWGLARPITLRAAAIRADLAAGTDEVISTALESRDDEFGALNVTRAAALLRSVPPRRFRPPLTLRAPLVPLALSAAAAILLFIPAARWGDDGNDAANLSALKIQKLERDAKVLKKLADETENPDLRKLHAELKQLVQALKTGDLTKKEALAKLAELTKEGESVKQELEDKKKGLGDLAKNPETKSLADAASQGNMDKAKAEAKGLADKMASGAMSKEAKDGLKGALDRMSKSSSSELSDASSKASDALDRGDSSAFEKEMGRVAENLKGGNVGESASSGGNEGGPSELDEALSDMEGASDDMAGGDGLAEKGEFCPECGKRKPSDGGS